MLRSIFSLICKIKSYEEDLKQSKNTNSNQPNTIYYLDHPDCIPTVATSKMDKQKGNKDKKNEKAKKPTVDDEVSLKINSEKGDVVSCTPVPKHKIDTSKKRTTFVNDQEAEKNEDKDQSELSANRLTELLHSYTKKQKKITGRDVPNEGQAERNSSPDRDELSAISKQVTKMQDGLEKLKIIAQNFNCLDRFKDDVEYIRKYINLTSIEKKD